MSDVHNRTAKPVDIGSRLELMVDDYLIDQMIGGAALRLHQPKMGEVVMATDEPWEGNACLYRSVFQDGDRYRMYYGAYQYDVGEGTISYPHPRFLCYAESQDGIQWTKPELGLVSFAGSKRNNIVLTSNSSGPEIAADHVAVIKDTNPNRAPAARYKAIAAKYKEIPRGLFAYQSPDGIHFSPLREQPIITEGIFDSLNLAFWDGQRGQYRAYFRDFRGGLANGVRDILTATSDDFLNWTDPARLSFPGAPSEHLYTNQIMPYARAPHIFVGFPMRYVDRGWTHQTDRLPGLALRRRRSAVKPRYGSAVTDALFMSSRDGLNFRRWGEAFIRPGLRPVDNWVYGDNCVAWGLVETQSAVSGAPNTLSLYTTESYWTGHGLRLRRYTLRIDGFVSVNAPLEGGEFRTKPLLFDGERLALNYSTSAAGSIRVEVQDTTGRPQNGLDLANCPELFGDSLEQTVHWNSGSALNRLAGQPIRLRFVLRDADLYAFQFL